MMGNQSEGVCQALRERLWPLEPRVQGPLSGYSSSLCVLSSSPLHGCWLGALPANDEGGEDAGGGSRTRLTGRTSDKELAA